MESAPQLARQGSVRDGKTSGARRVLVHLGLALTAILVYVPALAGGFVWDDQVLIVENPAIRSAGHVGEILSRDFFHMHDDATPYGYYRPLVTLSYLLDYRLWGLDPFGFHVTNVLLHAAGTILVALILRRLRLGSGVSLSAALLFAVHPIHTENVAWIAGRTDLLAFLLTAAAFLLHMLASEGSTPTAGEPAVTGQREPAARPILVVSSVAAFAAGLLAKEMSVVLIPWLALFLRLVRQCSWRRIAVSLSPYLLVLAAYGTWRFGALGIELPDESSEHSLARALMSAPPTTLRYLGWMLLPVNLSAYVQNPYVTTLGDPRLLGALLLLGLIALFAWRLLRGREERLVCAMLLVSFLPILNLVRVAGPADMGNAMSERFCYFPSFPFLAMVALLARRLLGEKGGAAVLRPPGIGLLTVVTGLGAAQTVLRTRDWRDDHTFVTKALEQSPSSPLLWRLLALCRLRSSMGVDSVGQEDSWKRTELDRAKLHGVVDAYRTAARLAPGDSGTQHNLGAALYRLGDRDGAMRAFREAIRIDPSYVKAHINLGAALQDSGETDSAIAEYRTAIELLGVSETRSEVSFLGDLSAAHYNLGRALLARGDAQAALPAFREALRIRPELVAPLVNDALQRASRGDLRSASAMLGEAMSVRPQDVAIRSHRARALASLGQLDEARAVIQAGMERASGNERDSLAQVLANMRAPGPPREPTPPGAKE